MPTINTESIEGFESMTAEQKVEALLGVEIPERVDLSGYVKKSVFDAKASEAAELSKKLKGKMSEDELAQAERERIQAESDAKYNALDEKYNALLRKSTISEYTAKYVASGMDAALAEDTAKALADGDMAKVFENQAKHQENLEKKIKADLMKSTPRPGGTGGDGGDTESPGMEQARNIGKAKAAKNQTTADVMKHYI